MEGQSPPKFIEYESSRVVQLASSVVRGGLETAEGRDKENREIVALD
jgi:hypothetical protein